MLSSVSGDDEIDAMVEMNASADILLRSKRQVLLDSTCP